MPVPSDGRDESNGDDDGKCAPSMHAKVIWAQHFMCVFAAMFAAIAAAAGNVLFIGCWSKSISGLAIYSSYYYLLQATHQFSDGSRNNTSSNIPDHVPEVTALLTQLGVKDIGRACGALILAAMTLLLALAVLACGAYAHASIRARSHLAPHTYSINPLRPLFAAVASAGLLALALGIYHASLVTPLLRNGESSAHVTFAPSFYSYSNAQYAPRDGKTYCYVSFKTSSAIAGIVLALLGALPLAVLHCQRIPESAASEVARVVTLRLPSGGPLGISRMSEAESNAERLAFGSCNVIVRNLREGCVERAFTCARARASFSA